MKKLAMLALLLVPALGWSYEVKGNPDLYPSLGVNYSGASLKGDMDYQGFNFATKPQMKEQINNFMGDLRLPVSPALTLEAGLGYAQHNIESNDGTIFLTGGTVMVAQPVKTDLSGASYKVGARVYFH